MNASTYALSCDCGALTLTAHGEPAASEYCHCATCRAFHGVDMTSVTAWPEAQVELPAVDANAVFEYAHPHKQMRRFGCARCGTLLYARHRPGMPVIEHARFRVANDGELPRALMPARHLFYAERVIDIDDELPKYRTDAQSEIIGA